MSDINKILIGDNPVKDVFLGTVPVKGVMLGETYKYAVTHSAYIKLYPGVAQISYSIVVAGTEVIRQTLDIEEYSVYRTIKIPDIPHGACLNVTASCYYGYTILNSPIYPINSVIVAMANFVIEPIDQTTIRDYFRIYTILDQQLCSACSFDLTVLGYRDYVESHPSVFGEQRIEINGASSDIICVDIRLLDDYQGFTQLESIIYNNKEQAMTESGTYPVYLTCNDKYAGDIYISLKHTPDSSENVDLTDDFGTVLKTDFNYSDILGFPVAKFIQKQGVMTLKYGQGSLRVSGLIPSNFPKHGIIGFLPIGYRPAGPISFKVSWTTFWDYSTNTWKPWDTSREPLETTIIIDRDGAISASTAGVFTQETLTLTGNIVMKQPYYEISSVNFEVIFDKDGTVRAVRDFNTIYN